VEAFASVFWRFINPHLPVWSGVRNNSIALFYKVEGQFAEDFFRDSFDSGGTKETIIDPSQGTVCGEKTTKALRKVLNDVRRHGQKDDQVGEYLKTKKEILEEINKSTFFQRILGIYTKRYRNL
jgi:hypothetical protein